MCSTARLYHSLLYPNVFSDVNGQYLGFDGAVRTVAPGRVHYANFAGWDIYRSQIPLIAMLTPSVASDIAQSLVVDATQSGGRLPKWSLANAETYVMVGDPAASIIAGAYAFGAPQLRCQHRAGLSRRPGQPAEQRSPRPELVSRPRLCRDRRLHGVLHGLCAGLDHARVRDRRLLDLPLLGGRAATAQPRTEFARRAANWQQLFDADDGFLQQKLASSQFVAGPNPTTQYGYAEGNPLQYAWAVPHDFAGVIAAMGGPSVAVARLNELFAQLNAGPERTHGLVGQ